MNNDGRYKCKVGDCRASFDDESQRDLHEATESHCTGCGESRDEQLTLANIHSLCKWCAAERVDTQSIHWN